MREVAAAGEPHPYCGFVWPFSGENQARRLVDARANDVCVRRDTGRRAELAREVVRAEVREPREVGDRDRRVERCPHEIDDAREHVRRETSARVLA